jgi:CubicO group peptidase (beta-lactamase class C family)
MDIEFPGGAYGYGLFIFRPGDRHVHNGALGSMSTFGHGGNAGSYVWVDPERDLIGVYLSVSPRAVRGVYASNSDLFLNAVCAAVVD